MRRIADSYASISPYLLPTLSSARTGVTYSYKDPVEFFHNMSDHYAFVAPIVPGQLDAWKSFVNELKTTRKHDYTNSRKRLGIKHERVWLEHTPMGDFAVVSFEGKDAETSINRAMTSKDPFDIWFAEQIAKMNGMSGNPPPPNELMLDIL
jgi:hypothetical protein